jgi:hypothetical protein
VGFRRLLRLLRTSSHMTRYAAPPSSYVRGPAAPIPTCDDVLDVLVGPVRKSLVVPRELADGSLRCELLETVRHHAREKLLARSGIPAH